MRVYLDNAATTKLAPEVLEAIMPYLTEKFGNPSSIHTYGRESRAAIETSRKSVAKLLNVSPAEIIFTSGGTEADNMAIVGCCESLGVTHVISSAIEHHAVTHTIEHLEAKGKIKASYVRLLEDGHVDLEHLESLLSETKEKTLVSLMHANNEIGNLLPIDKVGELCEQYGAYFHSDTVQTMGHYKIDLKNTKVHFVTGAAHKFHGPKGVGFLYINENIAIPQMIHGGAQERNMRGGTENLYGIVGLAKALELALEEVEEHQQYVSGLKQYMIDQLKENMPGVSFNGDAEGSSLYTVLNVLFPPTDTAEMLLFNLDIMGVSASGGSACSSGSNQGSHVLRAIGAEMERPSVRFSFSKYNTKEEIDYCIEKIKELYAVKV